uniref:Myosin motor domain-containing protein n=1 Tax=Panagrolaimus superbus TaxID=310955 RepID=A0A914YAS4_9BILA
MKLMFHALDQLGFSSTEKQWIFQIIAICILIGEIRFGERSGMDYSFVESMTEVEQVTKLLNVKSSKLVDALTQPTIKVGDNLIRKNQNLKKTLYSAAGLQKVLYERVFKWIVEKCNDAIDQTQSQEESVNFIGVLDMAGFEIMTRNSFEQFCINYTNEKLQQFFNHFMFVKEQAEYMNECIEWNQVDYGDDLQQTIDMVEKPMGLLSYLQEECIVPNGSDTSLLEKMVRNLADTGVFQKAKQSTKNTTISHFSVQHYAGQVNYNIDGWVEKNRDLVDQCLLEVLSSSSHSLISKLFPATPKIEEMTRSRRGSLTTATVTHVYREQLSNLLQTLNLTSAHFIRCIVPNYERQPFKITGPLVLHQLKCNGVLEGIRICRRGYPNRMPFTEFIHRYKLLAGNEFNKNSSDSPRSACETLFELLKIDEDRFQIGKTKVFCRVGLISDLENQRKEHINGTITGVQAYIRWYHEQVVLNEKHEKWNALVTIQKNVKAFCKLADWPWFKIWGNVRQVIPMNREKERIVELEEANIKLLEKLEKLEEENAELEEIKEDVEQELETLKEEKIEAQKKAETFQSEVKRNEGLLELMEKKFDEQHAKIMKLSSTQKENETNLELLESEKETMATQLEILREKYNNEKTLRENLEEEFEDLKQRVEQAERKEQQARDELDEIKNQISEAESKAESWQERSQRQSSTISELQHNISDLNEKINGFDATLHKEKSARRKCEIEMDSMEETIAHLTESLEKNELKKDGMKEQMRIKDNQIKKLEKKLEEKTDEMDSCIAELKKMHKAALTELQTQNDELKRKSKKLESENENQKIRLTDRESSVESDSMSRPGSRMSHSIHSSLGSRQYSTTSLCSSALSHSMTSSSIRTLGGARSTTDYGSGTGTRSPYDLVRDTSSVIRSPSYSRLTRSNTQGDEYTNLMRTPSTSQMQAKERQIQELEKKLSTANTDYQLLKREVDVYKTQLQEAERNKEQLTKQLKSANDKITESSKELKSEEKKAHLLEQNITKLNRDVETWKSKHEEAIIESKNDIVAEKKKHQERINTLTHEYEMKIQQAILQAKADNKLQTDLIEAQAQLDRAIAQINQLEKMSKSQFNIGENWEQQYRGALLEMEELRDENVTLKTKIRRQYKQIELLTRKID